MRTFADYQVVDTYVLDPGRRDKRSQVIDEQDHGVSSHFSA